MAVCINVCCASYLVYETLVSCPEDEDGHNLARDDKVLMLSNVGMEMGGLPDTAFGSMAFCFTGVDCRSSICTSIDLGVDVTVECVWITGRRYCMSDGSDLGARVVSSS